MGEALVRVGAVTENDITETLSQQFGVPSIDLASFEIDPPSSRSSRGKSPASTASFP